MGPNTRMRWIVLTFLMATSAAAGDCPAAPDHRAALAWLIAKTQSAQSASDAQQLNSEMWILWRDAPDARAQGLLDRGIERREAYDFEAASEALDELVAYCPEYAEGYNQRAFVQFLRADYASALEDLERALDLSPSHIGALSGKAMTLMGLGRTVAAQATLRQALALNPWLAERSMLIEPAGEDI